MNLDFSEEQEMLREMMRGVCNEYCTLETVREMEDHSVGYPEGLSGEDIPIEARIITVADSFDAMTTSRPYRKALDRSFALEEIIRSRGTQFCPTVADVFVDIVSSFPEGLYRHINDTPVEEMQFD